MTLLYPWRTPPLDDRDIDAVRAAIANCAAFPITFSEIGRFPRDRALYLKIQNNIPLRTLMRAIHGSFPLVKETASWSPRSVRVARLLSAMFIVARVMVIASLACFRLRFYETE